MSSEQNKALIRRFYAEINKRNLAIIDELVATEMVDHDAAPGEPKGPEGTKQTYATLLKAFPDLQISIDYVVAEGDMVVVRWTNRGTHKGEFFGFPASGKGYSFTGTGTYRITGGKIVEHWLNYDQFGLMQQLGMMPPQQQS